MIPRLKGERDRDGDGRGGEGGAGGEVDRGGVGGVGSGGGWGRGSWTICEEVETETERAVDLESGAAWDSVALCGPTHGGSNPEPEASAEMKNI